MGGVITEEKILKTDRGQRTEVEYPNIQYTLTTRIFSRIIIFLIRSHCESIKHDKANFTFIFLH